MRDLARAIRVSGAAVSIPWPSLARLVRPRRGNLMIVLAAPGVGKSTFALGWAAALGEPSLYVSLDTSLVDQAVRLVALRHGYRVDDVLAGHDSDLDRWVEHWDPVVRGLDYPIRFFDRSAGTKQVSELVEAEFEYWGEYPALTIVDNADGLLEAEESAQEFRRIFHDLHRLAREKNTLVLALHHIRRKPPKPGSNEDPTTKPIRLQDGLYAGDQDVQHLLGMWRLPNRSDRLKVGVLKNRMGPMGETTLVVDLARARVEDASEVEAYLQTMGGGQVG